MSPAVSMILVLMLVAIATASVTDKEWREFKAKHGKQYEDLATEQHRRDVYSQNKEKIRAHNERFRNNQTTFTMGVNKFTDMTFEEFSARMLMRPRRVRTSGRHQKPATLEGEDGDVTVKDAVDWRDHDYVTEVKFQGYYCGSCWAFSAVGSLEGQHAKKTGQLVSLSEQNLMDCASEQYGYDASNGCGGGTLEDAFNYVKNNGGIDTEESYQYEFINGQCRYDQGNSGATISGYQTVEPSDDEEVLKQTVGTVGPVSAGIFVTDKFQHLYYASGVYYDETCIGDYATHAITIVGYGTENGEDYWLIKNSWDVSWGESGYLKMARNRNNNCLIASHVTYPLM